MVQTDPREIQKALAEPFAPEDLEWRLQHTFEDEGEMRGIAVPYVTNRAIQNRLDNVIGPENWYNDYKPWHGTGKKDAQICGISIYFEDRGFVTKWDGAEDSDIEPIKGGLSDSMKRAAVQWGIGRVLYNMDAVFVNVEKRGKSWYIKKGEKTKLNKAYLDMLKRLDLTPPSKESQPKPTLHPTSKSGKSEPTPLRKPEYKVLSVNVQKGVSGKNTRLKLENSDGKSIDAFIRGEHPDLTDGARLADVQLEKQQKDTVLFYVLKDYTVVPETRAA